MAEWMRFLAQYPLAVWRTVRMLNQECIPPKRRGLWRLGWAMRYCWNLHP